jgi:hypothetical protein
MNSAQPLSAKPESAHDRLSSAALGMIRVEGYSPTTMGELCAAAVATDRVVVSSVTSPCRSTKPKATGLQKEPSNVA